MLRAQWPAPARIQAFTTTRDDPGHSLAPFERCNLGSRCGDEGEMVELNRQLLVDSCRLPSAPMWLRQVHGTSVARFEMPASCNQPEPEADASVTCIPGKVLAVLSADCLSVLFCSLAGDEVAAAHAGWRGLAAGVLEKTVESMRTPPTSLLAWLGPAAGPCDYEIGAEVHDRFVGQDPSVETAFTATRSGHWRVDLYALARQRLRQAGVSEIFGGGLSTIAEPLRFYSHRRDGRTGRMASLIWIEPATA